MSKLDEILDKALWNDEHVKRQIKDLILELIGDPDKQDLWAQDCETYAKKLIKKVEEL